VTNGQLVAQRILTTAPKLWPVGLLHQTGEGTYVGYAWTGREFPTDQDVGLVGDGMASKRHKNVQLIKQSQAVEPKEGDDLYLQTGPVPGMWSRFTIKTLEPQFSRWVFVCHGLYSSSVSPMLMSPAMLPPGTLNTAYVQQLTAVGGYGAPYTWAVTLGGLPLNLSLNPATGLISGTVAQTSPPSVTFTVAVSDNGGQSINQTYTLTVNPP
jgi:hypothetical protein